MRRRTSPIHDVPGFTSTPLRKYFAVRSARPSRFAVGGGAQSLPPSVVELQQLKLRYVVLLLTDPLIILFVQ